MTAIPEKPKGLHHEAQRRRMLLLCYAGWSVFVGLTVWWLLSTNTGPSVWVASAPEALRPAAAAKFRAWFNSGLGLQRVYPWLLFGPYIVLLVMFFPLERGRLHLNLPLNLAACAAFIAVSQPINNHTSLSRAKIVIFDSQVKSDGKRIITQTNSAHTDLGREEFPDVLQDRISQNIFIHKKQETDGTSTIVRRYQSSTDPFMTNLAAELHDS